jgi:hypothetical protein
MKSGIFFVIAAILVGSLINIDQAPAGSGQNTIFELVNKKCAAERTAYCKAAMPTDARLALCLYAHEDKLSTDCAIAVYNGFVALQLSLNTLSNYAKTCRSDLLKFCSATRWGQGRLYQCLLENKAALVPECQAAVDAARPEMQKLGIGN